MRLRRAGASTRAACGQPGPGGTAAPLELVPLQDAEGTVYGAAGPDGYYSVVSTARADGSLNIRYTDYASMQTVYLCAQPNCAHDSESCTSYQPGGSGVSLMMAGGQLVLVSPGTGPWGEQPSPPRVCVCGPDGSRRRQAASFEANQQLDGPYLTDGKNLYAALRTVQAQTATEELVCIDLGSGAVSTVLRWIPRGQSACAVRRGSTFFSCLWTSMTRTAWEPGAPVPMSGRT